MFKLNPYKYMDENFHNEIMKVISHMFKDKDNVQILNNKIIYKAIYKRQKLWFIEYTDKGLFKTKTYFKVNDVYRCNPEANKKLIKFCKIYDQYKKLKIKEYELRSIENFINGLDSYKKEVK